jgi:hypothetical protein
MKSMKCMRIWDVAATKTRPKVSRLLLYALCSMLYDAIPVGHWSNMDREKREREREKFSSL